MLQRANQWTAIEALVAGKREDHKRPHSEKPREKQIDIIVGGPTSDGDSASGWKAYARVIMEKCPKRKDEPEITFKTKEIEYLNRKDAMVASISIANARVKRVMIDTRSSVDVLYFDAFQKLRLTITDLSSMSSTLTGFTCDFIASRDDHSTYHH
ncbi:hypothetical protein BHM03_00042322 [Ensete ventricosum]|uniref:Uncharacterized protein n=1 Tax=Ensete ventricosum TaxID=4639 RepID=A0A445MKK7_ENSVE|nr:hypothetical protein BHM03_00042322 [Ensete ventricosum]